MRWALVAALAGCSQSSMAIEVHTTVPGVDHVELVIVRDQCRDSECTGVAPPSSIAKPTGTVYYQVGGDRFVANVDSDTAGFLLEPGDDDYVPRVIAIGFGGSGANERPLGIGVIETDFHIKEHLGEVFQLELAPHAIQQAEGAVPFDVGADDLVVVWRAPNAPATTPSCLAIQPRAGSATFVVPEADPDCDGITGNAECDPFWYEYVKPTSGGEQACFAQTSPAEPCIIGRETKCVDGQPDQCTPGTFCVPSVTCHDCSSVFDPSCLDKVAKNSDQTVAKITCRIPVVQQGVMFMGCPASAGIGLNPQFNGASCMPAFVPRTLALPFVPQSTLGFDTGEGVVNLTMVPSGFDDCAFQIALPTTPLSGIPQEQIPGVVLLHGAAGHQVVVPLVVDFVAVTPTACGAVDTRITCSAAASSVVSDPVWSCGSQCPKTRPVLVVPAVVASSRSWRTASAASGRRP